MSQKIKFFTRTLSIMLVLTTLITIAPLNAFALDANEISDMKETFTEALPVEILEEDVSLRSENTKHFRMSDGRMLVAQYGIPVHFEDKKGDFQEINNTLAKSDSVYTATNGTTEISIPENLGNAEKATLTRDKHSMSFSLSAKLSIIENDYENDCENGESEQAAESVILETISEATAEIKEVEKLSSNEILNDVELKATLIEQGVGTDKLETAVNKEKKARQKAEEKAAKSSENLNKVEAKKAEIEQKNEEFTTLDKLLSAVEYKGILPKTDLEYIVIPKGIKENLVINVSQESYTYLYELEVGDLIPEKRDNGTITFTPKGKNEKPVFILQAPYVYDSLGEISYAVTQEIEKLDDIWQLTVTIDTDWMNNESRLFPVVLDPTFVYADEESDVVIDTFVTNTALMTGDNSWGPVMYVGATGAVGYRGFVAMNMPKLPDNSVVVNANVKFNLNSVLGGSLQINAYEVPHSWIENNTGRSYTWNNQPFGQGRNSYLGESVLDAQMVVSNVDFYTFDITKTVREIYALNRKSVHIMLASSDEWIGHSATFRTLNTSLCPPVYNLVYEYPSGLEDDFFTHEDFAAGRAGTVSIGDYYRDINIVRDELSLGDVEIYRTHYQNWASEGISEAIKNEDFPYGTNWKLNYSQSLTQNGNGYIYINAKGNRIEFENSGEVVENKQRWEISDKTITDEDYTLWVPTSAATLANVMLKTDEGFLKFHATGYLKEIRETEHAAQAVTINYVSDTARISEIIDTSGRKFVFGYNGSNKLTSIAAQTSTGSAIKLDGSEPYTIEYTYSGDNLVGASYPDNEEVSYSFGANQVRLTDVDGYNLRIDRENNFVTKVQEYAGNTAGNWLKYKKDDFYQTTLTDNLGNKIIRQFDEMAQTVCTIDGDGNYISETYENFDTVTGKKQRGVILTRSGSDTTSINLLKNHSGEFDDNSWMPHSWGGPSTNDINLSDATKSYAGAKSLSMQNDTDFTTNGALHIEQVIPNNLWGVGKTFTFSGYALIDGELVQCTDNAEPFYGGSLFLSFRDNNGNILNEANSEIITLTDDEWIRLNLTATVPENTEAVLFGMKLLNAKGKIYFDALQLEKGEYLNTYNYVEDGDFNSNSAFSTTTEEPFSIPIAVAPLNKRQVQANTSGTNANNSGQTLWGTTGTFQSRCNGGFLQGANSAWQHVAIKGSDVKNAINSTLTASYPTLTDWNVSHAKFQVVGNWGADTTGMTSDNSDYKMDMPSSWGTATNYTALHTDWSDAKKHDVKYARLYTLDGYNKARTPNDDNDWRVGSYVSRRAMTSTARQYTLNMNHNDTNIVATGALTYPGISIETQDNSEKTRHNKLTDNALRLFGNVTQNSKSTVIVPTGAKAGESYLVGVWAKPINALPIHEENGTDRSFGFVIKNDLGTQLNEQLDFNPNNPNWQYVQTVVEVDTNTDNLIVELNFNKQLGAAYFDGLQVQLEDINSAKTPEEDKKPGIKSADSFSRQRTQSRSDANNNTIANRITDGFASLYEFNEYDLLGNIVKSIDSVGNSVEYVYDPDSDLLKTVTAGGNEFVEFTEINLLENAGFEDSHFSKVNDEDEYAQDTNRADSWLHDANTDDSWAIIRTADAAKTDSFGYKLSRQASGTAAVQQVYGGVVPGERYNLSAWLKVPNETIVGNGVALTLETLDANMEIIDSSHYSTRKTTGSSWEELSLTLILPDDGRYLRVGVELDGIGMVYVDDIMLEAVLIEGDSSEVATSSSITYSYNAMGELVQSQQLVSDLDGGTHIENSYTYQHNRLQSITHNDMTYNFEYDGWGNMAATKVGSQNLITYSYTDDWQRNLDTITYANGDTVSHTYNQDNKIIKVSHNNVERFEYEYSKDGELAKVIDKTTNTIYEQTADEIVIIKGEEIVYSKGYLNETFRGLTYNIIRDDSPEDDMLSEDEKQLDELMGISASITNVYGAANYTTIRRTDYFGRTLTEKVDFSGNTLLKSFGYTDLPGGRTTNQVENIINTINDEYFESYSYKYDTAGNIIEIRDAEDNLIAIYTYDEAGQLTSESISSATTSFVYDKGGNIVQAGDKTFTYDSVWTDRLTSVNSLPLTYDVLGNLTAYDGNTLNWQGKQLVGFNDIAYAYNQDDLRISKTVDNMTTEYTWDGEKFVGQFDGTDTLLFFYDDENEIIGFNYNEETYFYLKNLQGDIVGIVDESGEVVATYAYDAWGNELSVQTTGSIGDINPMRYRGYYWDADIQMYYCLSRYYNPSWYRFISADKHFDTEDGILGTNMYIYCHNNPVSHSDGHGEGITNPKSVTLDKEYIVMRKNKSTNITATTNPKSIWNSSVKWYVKNNAIATIDKKTGKKRKIDSKNLLGWAYIEAKVSGPKTSKMDHVIVYVADKVRIKRNSNGKYIDSSISYPNDGVGRKLIPIINDSLLYEGSDVKFEITSGSDVISQTINTASDGSKTVTVKPRKAGTAKLKMTITCVGGNFEKTITINITQGITDYLNNIDKSSNITSAKKDSSKAIAKEMLDAGLEVAFVAGMLANHHHEGNIGQFEYYSSIAYMQPMQNTYSYKSNYSGQYIYNKNVNTVNTMVTTLHNNGWEINGSTAKFGLGSIQWTGTRTKDLLDRYRDVNGKSKDITLEQAQQAEGKMIVNELKKSSDYKNVHPNWKNAVGSNLDTQNAAYEAGYRLCYYYERPTDKATKSVIRGNLAKKIYADLIK